MFGFVSALFFNHLYCFFARSKVSVFKAYIAAACNIVVCRCVQCDFWSLIRVTFCYCVVFAW